MNPLRTFCLAACLITAVCARGTRSNSLNNNMQPTDWLSVSELEAIPALNEITWEQLENMPTTKSADWINKLFHIAQASQNVVPNYVPSNSDIPAYTYTPEGQKVNFNVAQMTSTLQQQPNFGNQEVTIVITGLPSQSPAVGKANRKLVQAYLQRYNGQRQQNNDDSDNNNQNDNNQNSNNQNSNNQNNRRTSSEEDYNDANNAANNAAQQTSGNIVVIDLGAKIDSFERFALIDVEKTGAQIGNAIVQLTQNADVPNEIVHLVGQGVGAHVAGAAARQYTRMTGNQLRRVTGLDPSKIFAKRPNTLVGLARGNANFVDAIHTSAYGLGTPQRAGDIDFYPNGPSVAAPGSDNIIEASMRATRYFAESVRPGNERNFPAVAAESLQQYKNNNGYGQRAFMGIATDFDLEGDYVLQVNTKSPFGQRASAQKQNNYHGRHQYNNMESSNEN